MRKTVMQLKKVNIVWAVFALIFLIFSNFGSIGVLDPLILETDISYPLPGISESEDGKAVTNIGIELPPANGDASPKLALVYNSGSGSGILGIGWQLAGIPSISKTAYQSGKTLNSAYISGLGGELIEIDANVFHPKTESFIRHIPVKSGNFIASWKAQDTKGSVYTFGSSNGSKIISDSSSEETLIWGLDSFADINGNSYSIAYDSSEGYLLPTLIQYNNGSVRVIISYESRPDVSETYYMGKKVKISRRISSLSVELDGSEIRKYSMIYEEPNFENNIFHSKLRTVRNTAFKDLSFNYFASSQDQSYRITQEKSAKMFSDLPLNNLNYGEYYKNQDVCALGTLACACSAKKITCGQLEVVATVWCQQYTTSHFYKCTEGDKKSLTFLADVNGDTVPDFVRVTGMKGENSITANVIDSSGMSKIISSPLNSFRMNPESQLFSFQAGKDLKADFLVLSENNKPAVLVKSVKDADAYTYKSLAFKPDGLTEQKQGAEKDSYKQKYFITDLDGNMVSELVEFVDLGDSKSKILVRKFNPSTDEFESAQELFSFKDGSKVISNSGSAFQMFVDLDRNGTPDFIRMLDNPEKNPSTKILVTFFEKKTGGTFAEKDTVTFDPGFAGKNGNRFLTDINGDGYPDFVTLDAASNLIVHLFNGKNFVKSDVKNKVENTYVSLHPDEVPDPDPEFENNSFIFRDMDKDGNRDMLKYIPPMPYADVQTGAITVKKSGNLEILFKNHFETLGSVSFPISDIDNTGQYYTLYSEKNMGGVRGIQSISAILKTNWSTDDPANPIQDWDKRDKYGAVCKEKPDMDLKSGEELYLLLKFTDGNQQVHHLSLSGLTELVGQGQLAKVTQIVYGNSRFSKFFADINGDGRQDFIHYYQPKKEESGKIYIHYGKLGSDGNYFNESADLTIDSNAGLAGVADIDKDGIPELINLHSERIEVVLPYNMFLTDFFSSAHKTDGVLSVIKTGVSNFSFRNLLTGISNGLDSVSAAYKKQTDSVSYAVLGSGEIYSGIFPEIQLSKTVLNRSDGLQKTVDYTFVESRFYLSSDPEKSRKLGFTKSEKKLTQALGGRESKMRFVKNYTDLLDDSANFNLLKAGTVLSEQQYATVSGNEVLMKSVSYEYGYTAPVPAKSNERISLKRGTETNSVFGISGLSSVTKVLDITEGSYGNVTSASEVLNGVNSSGVTEYDIADYLDYKLVRPRLTKKYRDGIFLEGEEVMFSGNQMTESRKYGTESVFISTVFSSHDSYNVPQTVTDPEGNITNLSFGSTFRKEPETAVFNSNPMYTIKKTYDRRFGKESGVTEFNGGILSKEYDSYGRLVRVTVPGESKWSEIYNYKNTGNSVLYPSGNAAYVEKITRTKGSDSVTVREYRNADDKTYRKEGEGPDGKKIIQESVYDALYPERLLRKTENYLSIMTPQWTVYEYDDFSNLVKETAPDGSYILYNYNYLPSGSIQISTVRYSSSGSEINAALIEKDRYGNVVKRTVKGTDITYKYDGKGNLTDILDSKGSKTSFTYDEFNRTKTQKNPNSGTVSFTYNRVGKVTGKTDARGTAVLTEYDFLYRPKKISTGNSSEEIRLVYDDPAVSGGIGRLSRAEDGSGYTKVLKYDLRGNVLESSKFIQRFPDSKELFFRAGYDLQNRVTDITYPNGIIVHNEYAESGMLNRVTMDMPDQGSFNHPVVSYEGPIIKNDKPGIVRTTGNGVRTEIFFDPFYKRPTDIGTVLHPDSSGNGDYEQRWLYDYDDRGNLKTLNYKKPRNSGFENYQYAYDSLDRLISVTDSLGTETYEYDSGGTGPTVGNLTKKGEMQLIYGNSSRPHQVTSAVSPTSGTVSYSYDAVGNMISRPFETMSYNSFNMLSSVENNGQIFEYLYDYTGNRVYKNQKPDISSQPSRETFTAGIYEVNSEPGQPLLHTAYIRGANNDIASQITLNNSVLIAKSDDESDRRFYALLPEMIREKICPVQVPECTAYHASRFVWMYRNAVSLIFLSSAGKVGTEFKTALSVLFVFILCSVYLIYAYYIQGYERNILEHRGRLSLTPLLLISVLLLFTDCGGKTNTASGDVPWILFAPNTSGDTSSMSSSSGPPEASPVPGLPSNQVQIQVTGMFFFHSDHLGSVTMITDGNGNRVTGGSGASQVSYRPYGEIDRQNSYGPDIFKYKYTGQEEDKETGLYYYKARHYDPVIGRFLQADSHLDAGDPQGQNLYAYVNGNPMKYNDPSGHFIMVVIGFLVEAALSLGAAFWVNTAFVAASVALYAYSPDFRNFVQVMGAFVAAWTVSPLGAVLGLGSYAAELARTGNHEKAVEAGERGFRIGVAVTVAVAVVVGLYLFGAWLLGTAFGKWIVAKVVEEALLAIPVFAAVGASVGSILGYFSGGLGGYINTGEWDDKEAGRRASVYGETGARIGGLAGGIYSVFMTSPTLLLFFKNLLGGSIFTALMIGDISDPKNILMQRLDEIHQDISGRNSYDPYTTKDWNREDFKSAFFFMAAYIVLFTQPKQTAQ